MFVGEIERYRQGITYREDPHVDVDTGIRKGRALVLGPNPLTGFLLLTSFPSRHLPIEYGIFSRILSFVSTFSPKKKYLFLDFWPSSRASSKTEKQRKLDFSSTISSLNLAFSSHTTHEPELSTYHTHSSVLVCLNVYCTFWRLTESD